MDAYELNNIIIYYFLLHPYISDYVYIFVNVLYILYADTYMHIWVSA